MWRAVITQALMDAGSQSLKKEARFHKYRAIAWFSKRNKDLQAVCALAGLDADYVMQHAKVAIANSCKWRSPKGRKPKSKQTKVKT